MVTRASAAVDRGLAKLIERRMAPRTRRIEAGDPRRQLVDLAPLWFDGGHVAHVGRGEALRTVHHALDTAGFAAFSPVQGDRRR